MNISTIKINRHDIITMLYELLYKHIFLSGIVTLRKQQMRVQKIDLNFKVSIFLNSTGKS